MNAFLNDSVLDTYSIFTLFIFLLALNILLILAEFFPYFTILERRHRAPNKVTSAVTTAKIECTVNHPAPTMNSGEVIPKLLSG